MAYLTINNIKISGVAACVPKRVEENINLSFFADRAEAEKVIASTGISRKRVCENGVTSSDLAVPAVGRMLADLGWVVDSVDCLFFVSMTRDYIAPQTACILQNRLGLRDDCFVMDLPLGCSGWVYGMSVIGSMMQTGQIPQLKDWTQLLPPAQRALRHFLPAEISLHHSPSSERMKTEEISL